MRRNRRYCGFGGFGAFLAAFGAGIFAACCFPSSFLLGVIAFAVIIIGIIICKC